MIFVFLKLILIIGINYNGGFALMDFDLGFGFVTSPSI